MLGKWLGTAKEHAKSAISEGYIEMRSITVAQQKGHANEEQQVQTFAEAGLRQAPFKSYLWPPCPHSRHVFSCVPNAHSPPTSPPVALGIAPVAFQAVLLSQMGSQFST